ncbi:MAG TPA: hypothetical protein VHG32_18805 [Thermoanaerobaculia bacterium]|jgi:hypothetical protein|nr:hypothetical protein [Thermoanaerobaculia bacterium]
MRAILFVPGALALLFFAHSATAAPLTNPLTADQVTCDELQLERLALRAAVVERLFGNGAEPVDHPSLFLWRSSEGGGVYSALAVEDGIRPTARNLFRAETQLAFDISLHAAGEPLNPAHRLLPFATIVRREQDSNLATPTARAPYLTVTLALEANAQDAFNPIIPLQINNLAAPSDVEQPAAHGDAAGRGITQDALTSSCDNLLTPFDQRIFSILSRTVRVSQCALMSGPLGTCNPDGSAYNVTLFRGADPQTYRANVYEYDELCDTGPCTNVVVSKVAYEFKVRWDAAGSLTTGEVKVLPACAADTISCSYGGGYPLFVLPPLWAGHAHQGQHLFDVGARVGNDQPGAPLRPRATVNWQALLANSAWN